jgi:hypothetical protein
MPLTIRQSTGAARLRNVSGETVPAHVFSVEEQQVVSSAGVAQITLQDVVVERHSDASYNANVQIRIEESVITPSFESLTPSVVSVDPYGLATVLSEGRAIVLIRTGPVTRRVEWQAMQPTGATVDVFSSWAEGSVARHMTDAVDSRLAGKSAATALRIFTTQNHSSASYVRNTSLWCADLAQALTCLSPWNSNAGAVKAGTAVTPRHVVFAGHYSFPIGTTLRFVAANNAVIERILTHTSGIPGVWDLRLGLLSSDLPASITPAKVLPSDYANWMPHWVAPYRVPGIRLDAEEKALVGDAANNDWYKPTDTKRLEFYEDLIGGDSGNAGFLLVNSSLVITNTWYSGGAGGGAPIHANIPAINQSMAALDGQAGISTGYTLTPVDLSPFTAY